MGVVFEVGLKTTKLVVSFWLSFQSTKKHRYPPHTLTAWPLPCTRGKHVPLPGVLVKMRTGIQNGCRGFWLAFKSTSTRGCPHFLSRQADFVYHFKWAHTHKASSEGTRKVRFGVPPPPLPEKTGLPTFGRQKGHKMALKPAHGIG